eukprot:285251_1
MVGDATNACYQPPHQPAQIPKINGINGYNDVWPTGPKSLETIELANEQLNNLSNILSNDLNINVVRPNPIDFSSSISTPFFQCDYQYSCTCPRDTLITIGNIIMEASMSRRDRYFEVYSYRPIVEELWKNDRNSFWKSAPKTSMNDLMYDISWHSLTEEQKFTEIFLNKDVSFLLREDNEIVFDAADFTK